MIRKYGFLLGGWIFLLVLNACDEVGGPGPRTWIDAPLNESILPLGLVVVQSHASSPGGTVSAALLVNGTEVRTDNAVDSASSLIQFSQVFEPQSAGEYLFQVITTDQDGNLGRSNIVRVHIGSVSETPSPVITTTSTAATETALVTSTFIPGVTASLSSTLTSTTTANSIPLFTPSQSSNCREGPGIAYNVKAFLQQGQSVRIDGSNRSDPLWWWVLIPGSNDHCWVSDSTGSSSGPAGQVPLITAPPPPATKTPTNTSVPPFQQVASPGNFLVENKTCTPNGYVVALDWNDVQGAQGYRVYRDNLVIITLPANVSAYDDTPPDFNSHSYYVQAYNAINSANSQKQVSTGCLY